MTLPGPILMNHVASNKTGMGTSTGDQAACEKHMARLGKMPLPTSSKSVVIEKECHQRYKKSVSVCADAAQRILVGDVMAVCHFLIRPDEVKNKSSLDNRTSHMVTMCQETVSNVASLDL